MTGYYPCPAPIFMKMRCEYCYYRGEITKNCKDIKNNLTELEFPFATCRYDEKIKSVCPKKTNIQININYDSAGNFLKCATCGDTYIHQYKTEVFERSDDSEKPLHCIIEGADLPDGNVIPLFHNDKELVNCPSPRRSGINIYFWCEECRSITKMLIYQHKGETFVEFKRYSDIGIVDWQETSERVWNKIIEPEKYDIHQEVV